MTNAPIPTRCTSAGSSQPDHQHAKIGTHASPQYSSVINTTQRVGGQTTRQRANPSVHRSSRYDSIFRSVSGLTSRSSTSASEPGHPDNRAQAVERVGGDDATVTNHGNPIGDGFQ